MIRLGLRLTLYGGKEAAARLAVTVAAMTLGVGMLLITLASMNAIKAQNARSAWLNTAPGSASAGVTASAPDPLWWLASSDQFGAQAIDRLDVAATGSRSPVPPGIAHLPRPGQFYVSPALSALLRSTPAAELRDRFPGHQIGTIGPSALPAPDALIIIIGHTAGQLSHLPDAGKVTSIQATPTSCDACVATGFSGTDLEVILAIAACALLFPLLIFIGAATRLAAARREQRFAAIRLAGGTPRQVSVISAVEASIAAVAGVSAGFGLFFLLRPALTAVPITGAPFAPGDLSLNAADILLVAIGVPAGATAAALAALRRVQLSPLGVSRRVTPPAPRAFRALPLVAGIAELAYFASIGHPASASGQTIAYLLGFLLIIPGLIIAGPWLTMAASRIMTRRTSRLGVLIAGRRLSDNPHGAFRSISGLILALFITSVAVGATTTITADKGPPDAGGTIAADTLNDQFCGMTNTCHASTDVPATVLAGLRSIRGVQGVTAMYTDPLNIQLPTGSRQEGRQPAGLVSCAQLSHTPALGRCAPGAAVAAVLPVGDIFASAQATRTWPAAALSPGRLQRLPIQAVIVGTNGSTSAIEQARTTIEVAYPYLQPPSTMNQQGGKATRNVTELQHMTDVVIIASLVIAGCSLAVSAAGSLSDRKRPFSLLRLTGVPLGILRGVVTLETAVPLLVTAVLSTGTGFLAAQLILRAQLGESLRPPGPEYYIIVLAGLIASLGVIALTFPLLKRLTGPETARNE